MMPASAQLTMLRCLELNNIPFDKGGGIHHPAERQDTLGEAWQFCMQGFVHAQLTLKRAEVAK